MTVTVRIRRAQGRGRMVLGRRDKDGNGVDHRGRLHVATGQLAPKIERLALRMKAVPYCARHTHSDRSGGSCIEYGDGRGRECSDECRANKWVIDASMTGTPFCFCPIEGDIRGEFTIVTGVNILSDKPPHGGALVGIVHPDGQKAVEAFCEKHKD